MSIIILWKVHIRASSHSYRRMSIAQSIVHAYSSLLHQTTLILFLASYTECVERDAVAWQIQFTQILVITTDTACDNCECENFFANTSYKKCALYSIIHSAWANDRATYREHADVLGIRDRAVRHVQRSQASLHLRHGSGMGRGTMCVHMCVRHMCVRQMCVRQMYKCAYTESVASERGSNCSLWPWPKWLWNG